MQVERVRAPRSATAWTGTNPRALAQPNPGSLKVVTVLSPPMRVPPSLAPQPGVSMTTNILTIPMHLPSNTINIDHDPDFPRRATSSKSTPVLYDPGVGRPLPLSDSRPSSVIRNNVMPLAEEERDLIEARLAAVSLSTGVTIGPPKVNGAPSYAKAVKRD
jgi:hypothetical protein